MKERSCCLRKNTINHISAQIGIPSEQIQLRINEFQLCGYNKAEIYQLLINGNGKGKPHLSGLIEDDLIAHKRFSRRRKHHVRIK
jgi:hypothetical protein